MTFASIQKGSRIPLALAAVSVGLLMTGCGSKQSGGADAAKSEQELQQLRADNQELQRLRAENQELKRLRKDNEEVKRLREQTRDLDQLRKDNNELRGQLQALKQPKPRP